MSDMLDGTHARQGAHYDGKDWFGDMMRVVEHPRLAYMVKVPRRSAKGLVAETAWYLDGENVGTREAAIAAYIASPLPTITEEQRVALELVGDEYGPRPEGLPSVIPFMELSAKGCIEHGPRTAGDRPRYPIRRTDTGRAVLAKAEGRS